MKIELGKDSIATIYINSNPDGKRAIRQELGEKFSEILPVTNRIKTFEDAREELGGGHEAVQMYDSIYWKFPDGSDLLAYVKLRIIVAALNEGWEPEFKENESWWFPRIKHYTPAEKEVMSAEEKTKIRLLKGGDEFGFDFAFDSKAWSDSLAPVSSHLALKSEELAQYAGTQFTWLFVDYLYPFNKVVAE